MRIQKTLTHCALFALAGTSLSTYAISNIESVRPGLPEEGWSGHFELSIDGETGNSEEENYSAGVRTVYRKSANIMMLLADGEYGTTRDIKDTDNAFIHTRWVHLINNKWASEAFIQWEEDEFDNLESRSLVGGGGRYIVFEEDDKYSLTVGLGAFREREKLDLDTYFDLTYTWRMNSYMSYKQVVNDNMSLVSSAYYQPSFDQVNDFRVLWTLGIAIDLIDRLQLKINYKVTHDSEPAKNLDATPPIDNHETNTEYATSLVYNF